MNSRSAPHTEGGDEPTRYAVPVVVGDVHPQEGVGAQDSH
jgi:hypothetical protein